jgi:hypothetical protein
VRGRHHAIWILGSIPAYALPGALIWSLIGAVVASLHVPLLVRIVAVAYAAAFGIAEVAWLPLQPPTVAWAVPATWLRRRGLTGRTVIWGALLGPGLATINPYGGMWMLPLLIALAPSSAAGAALGAAVGLIHGTTRAWGVIGNVRSERGAIAIMARRLYWRFADGAALLLVGSALAAKLL